MPGRRQFILPLPVSIDLACLYDVPWTEVLGQAGERDFDSIRMIAARTLVFG